MVEIDTRTFFLITLLYFCANIDFWLIILHFLVLLDFELYLLLGDILYKVELVYSCPINMFDF